MIIDTETCVGCWQCIRYCPFGAIKQGDDVVSVDLEDCLECGVCLRSGVCRVDAFYMQELSWPRVIRAAFSGGSIGLLGTFGSAARASVSGTLKEQPNTSISDVARARKLSLPRRGMKEALEGQLLGGGRGTSEMKTNDMTGRFGYGEVGVAAELGRPGIGFYFWELEKVAMAFAEHGAQFEPENPVTMFLDTETGRIKEEYEEIKQEKGRSAIIESLFPMHKIVEVFHALQEVGKEVNTVFTVNIISRCEDGTIPVMPILDEAGIKVRINGKTNMGMGRPLAE